MAIDFKGYQYPKDVILYAVFFYVRYGVSYWDLEDIMEERGVKVDHSTLNSWVDRFGLKFAKEIRKKRAGQHPNWQWHLDEVFVKINGERFYLWRAVDHEGEVLECYVTKRRNKVAAKKFLIKAMRKHGSPKIITTDKLPSYGAAFCEIGIANKKLCGGRFNNRCENSHLPFQRWERAMQLFRTAATLQRFVSYHSQIYNHFNHERHLQNRQTYKQKRTTALIEWFQICAS